MSSLPVAAALLQQGRFEDALAAIEKLAQSAQSLHLKGLCLVQTGQTSAGLEALEQALDLAPGDADLLRNAALAFRRAGQLARAAELLERLYRQRPDARTAVDLGDLLVASGALEKAERWLQAVDDNSPLAAKALALRATIAEQQGNEESAAQLARATLAIEPENFAARYVLAVLAIRQRQYASAKQTLLALNPSEPVNASLVAGRLAQCYAAEGAHQAAFSVVDKANSNLAASPAVTALVGTSHYGPACLTEYGRWLDADDRLASWAGVPQDSAAEPVFLVGFPRSGTTLLERMLTTMKDVEVVEEQPTLAPLLETFDKRRSLYDQSDLEPLQNAYLESLARHSELENGLVIDKMPLNSAFLALIYRLFPRARVVFALRDPRAVIFSCFMQSFGLNEAMAQFLNLDAATAYYDQVMRLADSAAQQLPLRIAYVRYEQLVTSPKAALGDVLKMLDRPWDASMLEFHRRRDRRINTPSYEQVTQPLYTAAVERWREVSELYEVGARLAPWIERFGYGDKPS